jgi:hypothetical protein
MGVAQDFDSSVAGIDYVHRRAGNAEIYLVRNGAGTSKDMVGTFRVVGRAPEVWDAVTGRAVRESRYEIEAGSTKLPLHLDPYGAAFVIFAQPEDVRVIAVKKDGADTAMRVEREGHGRWSLPDAQPGIYKLSLSNGKSAEIKVAPVQRREIAAANWKIAFQPGRGAPVREQPVKAFRSWTEDENPGVRYFSGTATYSTTVAVHAGAGERAALRLSDVHEICTVRVNGKEAGTIWAMPYVLDITDMLKDGENRVELAVTNLWPNRIIGDAQPSAKERFTHTNIRKYKADSPLLPSGLIGPVMLEIHKADALTGSE